MKRMLNMGDILYVLRVNQEGSFSRAAEKAYITQPALSKIVKKVEEELGIVIFDRGSAPLKPTHHGQLLLEYFQRIYNIQREIEDFCDDVHRKKQHDLNIGAPSFFCTHILPPIINSFQKEHPDYSIKLIETNDEELRKLLQIGILDFGITVEPNFEDTFASLAIGKEHIILAAPASYLINQNLKDYAISSSQLRCGLCNAENIPSVPMEKFSQERFLFLKQGNDLYRRGLKFCRDAGFEPKIIMELDQLLTAYYLAEAGHGITFIRSSIPYYTQATENLVFYKIDHKETEREIRGYYNIQNDKTAVKQQAFIEYIKEYPLFG